MIKMVTLDFDGTTADTMPALEQIAVRLMKQAYDLSEEEARESYRKTTGLPFIQQMEILFPGHEKNAAVVTQFEQEKIAGIFDLPLFPDAKATIAALRADGFLVAISSSTIQPTIERYCQLNNLELDAILGYREGFEKGKDHFEFLKEKFDLTADEMIYVGDSLKDCERAQGNNIFFVGKRGMFTKEQFNVLSKSKVVITDLAELLEIIQELNNSKN